MVVTIVKCYYLQKYKNYNLIYYVEITNKVLLYTIYVFNY